MIRAPCIFRVLLPVGVGKTVSEQHPVAVEADFPVPDEVLAEYGLEDAHIEPLSGGRTNRTMRARAGRDLVLQQMHGGAHEDLLGVMENLVRVTSHLDWRRVMEHQGERWYPLLVPTNAGKPFIMNADGDVWRAFSHRPGQILRSAQPHPTLASAAALYGRFAACTSDLGGPPLIETSPGFHNLDVVFEQFMTDFEASPPERQAPIASLRQTLIDVRDLVDQRCADDGVVWSATRVVHNDTKLSNVLFDRDHGRATAVLDLDLAMMGPCWHDLGDVVRSASWHDPAGAPPHFSVELFDCVAGAYAEAAGATISDAEVATFAVAGPRLSFELGLRYLNDHLRDEPHLRVSGENGHLRRGIANVKLAEEMLGAYDALRRVVDSFLVDRRNSNQKDPHEVDTPAKG